jgi:hypothetical protein
MNEVITIKGERLIYKIFESKDLYNMSLIKDFNTIFTPLLQ